MTIPSAVSVALFNTKIFGDRFVVQTESGQGGMGAIYRAQDTVTGEPVALKVLFESEGLALERFNQEAAVLAELRHPAIVRFVAHGVSLAGEPYLAMEWLDGETLEERLGRGALAPLEVAHLARRVLDALAVAHARGVVHRDIKPANLFLPGGDPAQIKLLDFGIARRMYDARRITQVGATVGTPMYMAPEQARGEDEIDGRVDIFSLGTVIYECLTGQPPFVGETPMAVLAKICLDESIDVTARCPQLPTSFVALLHRMLTKDRSRRPPDAGVLAMEMRLVVDQLTQGTGGRSSTHGSRSRLDLPVSGVEQRVLSVVLASKSAGSALPADQLVAELHSAVKSLGGRLDRLFDGSLVITLIGRGAPTDQAVQAAHCSLRLRGMLPDCRFAISTGKGIVGAELPLGEAIDGAAALLVGEAVGAICLDATSAGLLDARFEMEQVLGPKGSVSAGRWRLIRAKEEQDNPRTLMGRETVCVGRDRELGRLAALFGECVDESAARAVIITAPPGGGKSRVRFELLARLRARPEPFEVFVGQGDSLRAGAPFAILGPVLRSAAGIASGESPDSQRQKLAVRVARHMPVARQRIVTAFLGEIAGIHFPDDDLPALRAARHEPRLMADQTLAAWLAWLDAECAVAPVVLLLEDLHWGDMPSGQFVDAALRALENRPFFVLGFARPEIDEKFANLWTDRGVERMALSPLTSKACQRLIRQILGDVGEERCAWLVERADGNPFMLEELLRGAADGGGAGADTAMPQTVLGMVQARLDALGHEAKQILRAASVFGQTFPRAGVGALLGEAGAASLAAWLEILIVREVIFPREAAGTREFVFRHGLIRDAAYETLPDRDRRVGHRRAGLWLEQQGEHDAIVLVEHFERGGELPRAAHWSRFAAAAALDANDLAAVIERVERGVRCGAEGATLGHLRLAEAQARFWRGDYDGCERVAREAVSLLVGTPRFDALGELMAALGQQAHADQVSVWMRDVVAAHPSVDEREAWLSCLLRGSGYLAAAGVGDLPARVLALAKADWVSFQPGLRARVLDLRSRVAAMSGDQSAALTALEEAREIFESLGDERSNAEALTNLGAAAGDLGMFESAVDRLEHALTIAQRLSLGYVEVGVLTNLVLVRGYQGRYEDALAVGRAAVKLAKTQSDSRLEGCALVYMANAALLAGQADVAERLAREGVALLRNVPPVLPAAVAILSRALLRLGNLPEAAECARDAYALMEALGTLEDLEATVRLAYVESLAANRESAELDRILKKAVERLTTRAQAIGKQEWRESFLSRLPDHQRTLTLAQEMGLRAGELGLTA